MELLLRAKIDCDLDTFKNNLMKSSFFNYVCYPLLVFSLSILCLRFGPKIILR